MEEAIWKRKKGEPKIAYDAFEKYLKMQSPRSIDDYPQNGLPMQTLSNYHSKYLWLERANAYDEFCTSNKTFSEPKLESETIEQLKLRTEGDFRLLAYSLLDLLNKRLSKFIADENEANFDEINKLIANSIKTFNELQKLEFPTSSDDRNEFQIINNLIVNDEEAKLMLLNLMEKLRELKNLRDVEN